MRVAFTTWCTDDFFEATGCQKLINSARYFHPDIPFFRVNKVPEQIRGQHPHAFLGSMMAISCLDFIDDYDLVVHFDADSTITGSLNELLAADYEVAVVRNNNDFDGPGRGRYFTIQDIPADDFLNAGLVASTSKQFWIDWDNFNREKVGDYSGWENDTLNLLVHSKKYKTRILDSKDQSVFYGLASVSGEYAATGKYYTWASWKNAYVKDDKLFLDSPIATKQIKVIHQAGGQSVYPKQQYEKFFSDEVVAYLKKITA